MIILTCAYDNINHNYKKMPLKYQYLFFNCWAFKKLVWIEICERSKSQQPSLKKLFFGESWEMEFGFQQIFFPSLPQAKVEQTNGNIFLKLQLFEFYQSKLWLFKFQQFNLRLSKLQLSKKLLFLQLFNLQLFNLQLFNLQLFNLQLFNLQLFNLQLFNLQLFKLQRLKYWRKCNVYNFKR